MREGKEGAEQEKEKKVIDDHINEGSDLGTRGVKPNRPGKLKENKRKFPLIR